MALALRSDHGDTVQAIIEILEDHRPELDNEA